MSKGSQTTTQTTSTQPPPYIQSAYQGLISNTNALAQTPYTPYGGEGVAPINAQQQLGFGNINANAMEAQPFYTAGQGLLGEAASPLTPGQIMNYYNPFQENVVKTTQEQFNQMNQLGLNNIQGNAAAQGALGGDRDAVAKAAYYGAVLPGQEQAIAGLEQQGYQSALGAAAQQYQQNPESVAFGYGSLGSGAQNAALQGAGAQVGAGSLEQQTQQALDAYLYQQYLNKMGYPFALNAYQAAIDTGVGSLAGGTGYGQTTGPPPSGLAQGIGAAGSLFGGLGLFASGFGLHEGGAVRPHKQAGGAQGGLTMPYAGGAGYVPGLGLARGTGPPQVRAPGLPAQSNIFGDALNMAKGAGQLGKGLGSLGSIDGAYADPSAGAADVAGGFDLGTIGPGMTAAADIGAGADATAMATDLLPLALVQSGGRINYPGGLALPGRNRIQLPMRAGMGMPSSSFVKGYQEGGSPFDDFAGLGSNYDPRYPTEQALDVSGTDPTRQGAATALRAYLADAPSSSVAPPEAFAGVPSSGLLPVSQSASTGIEEALGKRYLASDVANQAYVGTPSRLGFASEQPGGGSIQTQPPQASPPPPDYQPSFLRPPLQPSARPQVSPGAQPGFLGISPDAWYGIMAAGLGTLAAARPGVPGLAAIGAGGLQGVQAYTGLKKGEADVEFESRKLDQQAQAERDRIDYETKSLAQAKQLHEEMTPYQRAELKLKEQQPQTILGPDNMLHTVRKNLDTGQFIDIFTNQPLGQAPAPGTTPQQNVPGAPQQNVPMSGTPSTQVASLGDVPSTRQMVNTGKVFNYASGAPAVSKGMDLPKPMDVAGKSGDALARDAEYYAATGKLPPLARGNSPVAMQTNAYRTAVQNYGAALSQSRGIDPQQQAMMWREAPLYGRFVMGADGRATVSLGTAVRHLDLLRQLATAWNDQSPTGIQTLRRIQAAVSTEFGANAATNLQAAGTIVGPEIIKAIGVAGAGTDAERKAAAAGFGAAASSDQMLGAISTVQGLLGGQLEGKMRQAKAAGLTDEQFKNLIGDRPFEILSHAGGQGKPPSTGGTANAGIPPGAIVGSKGGVRGYQTADGVFHPLGQ